MKYNVVINGKTFYGLGMDYVGVINNKLIQTNTFPQLKRAASIEANKAFEVEDVLYLLRTPGLEPIVFYRRNQKASNGTIKRGQWK